MNDGGFALGMIGFLLFFWLMFIGVSLAALVFWIFMIIDVAKRRFPKQDEQIVWVLVIVLTGIIGALIYYFVVKRKDKK